MFKSVAIGFVLAIAITVLSALLFVALQPHVSFAWAFSPGFPIRLLFESAGVRSSNQLAINSAFLFWWIVATIAVVMFQRRRGDCRARDGTPLLASR